MLIATGLVPTVQTLIMKCNLAELGQIKALVKSLGATFRITMGMGPTKTGQEFPLQYEPDEEVTEDCGGGRVSPAS